jgi:hypothetical protein
VADRKYSAASIGSRIDEFLKTTCRNGGYKLNYEIKDSELSGDDFETPDVMVKFSGADVDLLLSNRAELLLALEHLTMEMLRVSSDDHSRISFVRCSSASRSSARLESSRSTSAPENLTITSGVSKSSPDSSESRIS